MLWFLACTLSSPDVRSGKPGTVTDSSTATTDTVDSGPCPPEMSLVDTFCVDRWESTLVDWSPYEVPDGPQVAQSVQGVPPQAYLSGAMASDACEAAGKRLCTLDEWMRACKGPDGFTWPYGNTYDPAACNDSCAEHPVLSYWGDDPDAWDLEHMNAPGINQQPDTLAPTGTFPKCVSAEGVYDLHGNLHEWISDPDGTFKGGFYVDGSINGQGCNYTTTAHDFGYHDYSMGFRCCEDVRP